MTSANFAENIHNLILIIILCIIYEKYITNDAFNMWFKKIKTKYNIFMSQ